jgi:hypothetical protein
MDDTTGTFVLKCSGSLHIFASRGERCACGARTWDRNAEAAISFAAPSVGWECPRCHNVYGPHVDRCWCPAPAFYSTGTGPDAPSTQPTASTPAEASLDNSNIVRSPESREGRSQ